LNLPSCCCTIMELCQAAKLICIIKLTCRTMLPSLMQKHAGRENVCN
jgi:hypothetical protein